VSAEQVILLLGRRDQPTDGVADYCGNLRGAGSARGLSFESVEVRWAEKGWRAALAELRDAAAAWRDRWVLLQFTTLAWSRRGFPLQAPRVIKILRESGVHPGIVFHDFAPLAGNGIVGSFRENLQLHVLRQLYARSDLSIFTIPVKKISWLNTRREKAIFIPVGANCAQLKLGIRPESSDTRVIAIYGVTGGTQTLPEVADISFVMRQVSQNGHRLRLIVFGRGSQEAEGALRSALAHVKVGIEVLGVISPEKVTETLSKADVLLFVRGQISSRRGSAIAGIACGLPIVCYSGPDTDWPITDAGILPFPLGDSRGLAKGVESVLTNARLRSTLSDKSRNAHEKYFAWTAISASFAAAIVKSTAREDRKMNERPPGAIRVA
jgi:glycosyltransferase involved in cell wall biosynthesis